MKQLARRVKHLNYEACTELGDLRRRFRELYLKILSLIVILIGKN